jgi:hypothetical protein
VGLELLIQFLAAQLLTRLAEKEQTEVVMPMEPMHLPIRAMAARLVAMLVVTRLAATAVQAS